MLAITTEKDKENIEIAARVMFLRIGGFDINWDGEEAINVFEKLDPNKFYIAENQWDDECVKYREVFIPFSSKYKAGKEFSSFIEDMMSEYQNDEINSDEFERIYGNFLGYYRNNVGEFVPFEPSSPFAKTIDDNNLTINTLEFMYNGIWNNMRQTSALNYLDKEQYINNDDMLNTIAENTINQLFEFPTESGVSNLKLYQLAINGHPIWGNVYNPENSLYVSSVANEIKLDLEQMSKLSQTYSKGTSIDLQLITNIDEVFETLGGFKEEDLASDDFKDYISQKLQSMTQNGEIELKTQSIPMASGVNTKNLLAISKQASEYYGDLIFIKEQKNRLTQQNKIDNSENKKSKLKIG